MQFGAGTAGLIAVSLLAVTAANSGVLGEEGLAGSLDALQRTAGSLATDTADRIVPSLELLQVTGRIEGEGHDTIDALNLTVRMTNSVRELDLGALVVHLATPRGDRWFAHADAPGAGAFGHTVLRDRDGSAAPGGAVLTKGDLVTLDLDLRPGAGDLPLPTRTELRIELVPDVGSPLALVVETPMTYGADRVFTLDRGA